MSHSVRGVRSYPHLDYEKGGFLKTSTMLNHNSVQSDSELKQYRELLKKIKGQLNASSNCL